MPIPESGNTLSDDFNIFYNLTAKDTSLVKNSHENHNQQFLREVAS